MKTIGILLDLSELPFKLDLPNVSYHLDTQMEQKTLGEYLGKVIALNEGVPYAMLFAYGDNAEPKVQDVIGEVQHIVAQAAVSFGGWTCWDLIRTKLGIFGLTEDDDPDLYSMLLANIKLKSKGI